MLLPVQLILLQEIHKFFAIGLADSSALQTKMKQNLYAMVTRKR